MITLPLPIATDHPAFAGHFPANPVLPGVVLLDESLRAIDRHRAAAGSSCELSCAPIGINAAKFLSMVLPGEPVRLECEPSSGTTMTLRVFAGLPGAERLAMTGALSSSPAQRPTGT